VSRSYGETWVYESLVGGIPGLSVPRSIAVAIQFVLFEVGVLVFGWYYGLWNAVLAGTAAVAVAAVGSVEMHRLGAKNRLLSTPPSHKRLLFGTSIEIVLGVLAFIALLTYLIAVEGTLLTQLFGANPPIPVVYLTLLILWDLTYRIGTSWWSAVVALWRAVPRPRAHDGSTPRTSGFRCYNSRWCRSCSTSRSCSVRSSGTYSRSRSCVRRRYY